MEGPDQKAIHGADKSPITLEDCLARLSEARRESTSLKDKYLRAAAEVENVRKWAEREASLRAIRDKRQLLSQLLEVVDNLERALGVDTEAGELKRGVEIILHQLDQVLARAGVERIDVKAGQAFDPFYHEAIEVRYGEAAKDMVSDIVQSGYLHEGVVLRPARVVVVRRSPQNGKA